MRRLLAFAATTEALTGLCLLAFPSLVVKLLFDAENIGAGVIASRVAGIALMAFGAACWPTRDVRADVAAMLGYNLLIAIYFTGLGVRGELVGVLLWPVAAYHGAMVAPLGIAWRKLRKDRQ